MKKALAGLALAVLMLMPPDASAARVAIGGGDSSAGAGTGDVATDTIWDAAGDLAIGTGSNTAARLPKGSALYCLKMNAGATTAEWAACAAKSDSYVQNVGTEGDWDLLSDALGALPMWGEFVEATLGTGVKLVASSDTTANRARKVASKVHYAAAGEIGKFQLYMRKVGVAALYGTCVAEVYANGTGPTGATLSSSATVPLGDSLGYDWTPIEFSWTTPYVTAATDYWVAVSCGDYSGYVNGSAYLEILGYFAGPVGTFPDVAGAATTASFGAANTAGDDATESAELSGAAAGTWGSLGAVDADRGAVLFRVGAAPRTIKVNGRIVDSYIDKTNDFGTATSVKQHAWTTIDCASSAEIITDSSITLGAGTDSVWGFMGGSNVFVRNCNFVNQATSGAAYALGMEGCNDCGMVNNRVKSQNSGIFAAATTEYGASIAVINNKVTAGNFGIGYGQHSGSTSNFLLSDLKVINNDIQMVSSGASASSGAFYSPTECVHYQQATNRLRATISGNVCHADVGSAAKIFNGISLPYDWSDTSGTNKSKVAVTNNTIVVQAYKSVTANGICGVWDPAIGTGEVSGNTMTLESMDGAASSVGNCFNIDCDGGGGLANTLNTDHNRCRVSNFATNRAWQQTAAVTAVSRDDSLTPATYNITAGTLDRSPACAQATIDGTTPDALAIPGVTTTHACHATSATTACNNYVTGVIGLTPTAGSVSIAYSVGCANPNVVTVCCEKEP